MNAVQAWFPTTLVERIGWTLLHSVWQVLAVAVCLAVILPLLRRRGPRAGYAACCGALLLTVLLPVVTFIVLPSSPHNGAIPYGTEFRSQSMRPISIGLSAARQDAAEFVLQASRDPGAEREHNSFTSPAAPILPLTPTKIEDRFITERATVWGKQLASRVSPWLGPIVIGWAAGVLALSAWNVGGWFAVQRLKVKSAGPVPARIAEAATRIAAQLGLKRAVRLMQSALVESPLVIGVFKPVVLLPASLITKLPPDQLEALLAHELAHVLRNDYLVNLLQCAVETLLFYHPAVWWISNQVRNERENCCDDAALRLGSDRKTYVRALAAVAGARVPVSAPAAAGGLLMPRLRRILGIPTPQAAHPARWLTGVALLLLGVCTAVALTVNPRTATAESPSANAEEKKTEPAPVQKPAPKPKVTDRGPEAVTKGSIRVKVVDDMGKPIAQAKLHAGIWTEDEEFKKNQKKRDYVTNEEGIATVAIPPTLTILRLWASKKGFCQKFHNFQTKPQLKEFSIPEEFTLQLITGTVIGGVVKNERGEPIAGVTVEKDRSDDEVKTDEAGRWRMDSIPPGDDVDVELTFSHPDYISDQHTGEMQKAQRITSAALRAETATIVMQSGIRLSGIVLDPSGNPVKDAVVIRGDNPYLQRRSQEVRTDEHGKYRFPALAPGKMRVTVVAEGWKPDSRIVEISADIPPVDFQLQRGRKLQIRFVDDSGATIPNMEVFIERWRGGKALYNHKHSSGEDVHIPRQANGEGFFEWSWAPDDAVTYKFAKDGYADTEVSIAADGREHVQTIHRVLNIAGTVRDAKTGRPIDDFLAVPVIHFRPDFPLLERREARPQSAGRFSLTFERTDIEHGVQIEAPGYRTFRTSKRYRIGEKEPALDVQLQPSDPYAGRVVDAEGNGVPDARVYVATGFQHLDLHNLQDQDPGAMFNNNCFTNSGMEGSFEIVPQSDPYALVVIAPEGYAEVRRDAAQPPGEIRIQRYAKVTGRLMQSGKPVPYYRIYLEPIGFFGGDKPRIDSRFSTETAEDGSFVFERVPPIPCHVHGHLHFSRDSVLASSQSYPLRPEPGEQIEIVLGGRGIDVTGQLEVENAPPGFDYHFSLSYLLALRPGIEPPASVTETGFDWRKGWSDAWRSSLEGKAYVDTLHNWFVKPEPDGRFLISGVEPGAYDFAINLYGSTEGCLVHPVATRIVRVTVKPGDTTLDLGKVTIPSFPVPKVGDVAGDLEFTTPDGKTANLASLRGKYVLIDFWASWCLPCIANMDEVESLRRSFGRKEGLEIVGANLDADREDAQRFLKDKPLPWHQALLGEWTNTDVPRRFGISTVPSYVLVDPSGRIAAHEYTLEGIIDKLNGAKPKSD